MYNKNHPGDNLNQVPQGILLLESGDNYDMRKYHSSMKRYIPPNTVTAPLSNKAIPPSNTLLYFHMARLKNLHTRVASITNTHTMIISQQECMLEIKGYIKNYFVIKFFLDYV